jgi:hypothetical protein
MCLILTKDCFASLPTRMQGKCTTQPDAANFPSMNGVPLMATTSGQCLLLSNADLLAVLSYSFWADNLYLRPALPKGYDRQSFFPVLALVAPVSAPTVPIFLTNMIFQGDGENSTVGISTGEKVFVSGSHHNCSMFYCTLQASDNPKSVPSRDELSMVGDGLHVAFRFWLLLECLLPTEALV